MKKNVEKNEKGKAKRKYEKNLSKGSSSLHGAHL